MAKDLGNIAEFDEYVDAGNCNFSGVAVSGELEDPEECDICCSTTVKFRCQECKEWYCNRCRVLHKKQRSTKQHHLVPRRMKSHTLDDICIDPVKIKHKLDESLESMNKIDSEINKLRTIQINSLQESSNHRNRSLRQVNKHYDTIDSRIIQFIQTNISLLEEQKQKFASQIEIVKAKQAKLEKLVKQTADLSEEIVSATDVVSNQLKNVDGFSIGETDVKLIQGKIWDATESAILQLHGGVNTTSLIALTENDFFKHKQVQLRYESCMLRLVDKELWACGGNGLIDVYNMQLELQRSLSDTKWGRVIDIAQTENGDFVLASTNGLFHITAKGETLKQVAYYEHTCVVSYNSKIYTCSKGEGKIYIYKYGGNTWHNVNTITLCPEGDEYYDGCRLTLDISHDSITVCSDSGRIHSVSHTGQFAKTIWYYMGAGLVELGDAYICQQDFHGSLLIANTNKDQIQVLKDSVDSEEDKAWYVFNLEPTIEKPSSAVCIDNKLYVASQNMTLLLYKCGN